MQKQRITCKQMIEELQDNFCNHKGVYIIVDSHTNSYNLNMFADRLEVYDEDDKIRFQDDNGGDGYLCKDNINDIYLTDEAVDRQINIETKNSNIILLMV